MTVEQLGEALKQVQEAVIKGICDQMKLPNSQPRAEVGSAFGGSAKETGETGQPLRGASVNIAPSKSVASPYMSKEKEATWYMEQEASSHPPYLVRERSEKQNPTNGRFTERERIEERRLPSHRNFFKRMGLGGDPQ